MKAKRDETLEEIWAIRRQIAKQFGDDPRKRVAYYQRKQKELGVKIYRPDVLAGADRRIRDSTWLRIRGSISLRILRHRNHLTPRSWTAWRA